MSLDRGLELDELHRAHDAHRKRVRRRGLGVSLTAIAAVAVVSLAVPRAHAGKPLGAAPTSTTTTPPSTVATTTTPRATGCAGGFNATSVSFSDPLHGWTIGATDDDPACYVSRTRPLRAATTPISARVSTDGGAHWQPRGRIPVRAAQVIARADAEVWVWDPGLAHTVDGGRHWTTLDAGDSTLGLSVQGSSVWWLSRCSRTSAAWVKLCISRSQDDGATWQRSVSPVGDLHNDGTDPDQFVQLVRSDPIHGWLIAENADATVEFWRTVDSAQSWQRLPIPCAGSTSDHPPVAMGGSASSPSGPLTAVDGRHLFIVCTGGAADGSQGKAVLASADAGASWKWTGTNPQLAGYPAAMATPDLDTIVWSGPRSALNASFDAGRTWTQPSSTNARVAFDPADGGLGPIVFASPRDGWTIGQYTSSGSVIWATTDGGHTWSPTVVG